jgi:hypothetical protein
MIERSGDTMCGLYHAQGDKEPSLASKPVAIVLVVWPQNHSLGFLGLASKRSGLWFVSCATKLMGE